MSIWLDEIISVTRTISQILTAGIAITAFALLLYSFTFNLKERVSRTFIAIMFCLVIIFSAESFAATSLDELMIDLWLRVEWIGIILLPAIYLNFSDGLLATTGLPSRWRRKWAIRVTYLSSIVFLGLLFTPWFLGGLITSQPPAPHFQPTLLTNLFTIYYVVILILAWINFYRTMQRTLTRTSKRRMLYLTISAIGPVVGAFPFLLYSSAFASNRTELFWLVTIIVTSGLGLCIFLMAYAVAFFGMPWPDRVVKSRLIKWTLRGPVTASLALGLMTIVKRTNTALGTSFDALAPIVMVITVLICEYAVTLFFPFIEKWLVYDKDEHDFQIVRSLEERIITRSDLAQFIEMVLAAVTDQTQAAGSYLLEMTEGRLEVVEHTAEANVSPDKVEQIENATQNIDENINLIPFESDILIPLRNGNNVSNAINGSKAKVYGYLGVFGVRESLPIDPEASDALQRLAARAGIALRDRAMVEQVFDTLERLDPQEELIRSLRASSRFDQKAMLEEADWVEQKEMTIWVKGALTHYWGGPKLTDSPLMKLEIVKFSMTENDNNEINALRSVLRKALDQLKPGGERKYTGDWLLYNILDMKFMEGKKVREIAIKLAVSEADLYRKQKIAIDKIADILVQMEMKTIGQRSK